MSSEGARPRLAVRVTRDAERQLRGGHPWLYETSIRSVSPGGRAGDLAVVFDHERRFVAIGLYDPSSPIRVKVLHTGRPTTIDDAWFAAAVAAANDQRAELLADGRTDALRIVNGENDGLPGLVVDRYADAAVLKIYADCWVPHLDAVSRAVVAATGVRTVLLRLARRVDAPGLHDGSVLVGTAPHRPVLFRENGLRFEADLVHGHKTGHFLDQRDNREMVRHLAAGKDVLDVYACTGGFTVHAAAGGARSVTSVDLSPGAVATIERNLAHNDDLAAVRACQTRRIVGDALVTMDDLAERRERFDLVIIDPPSFAQKQASVPQAERAYVRINRRAITLVRDGGLLVAASCSSRIPAERFFELVHEAADEAGARLVELERTGHALDHPIAFEHGAYLKALVARVERRGVRR